MKVEPRAPKDMTIEELLEESAEILVNLYKLNASKRNYPDDVTALRNRYTDIHAEIDIRNAMAKVTTGRGIFGWFEPKRFF